MTLADVNVLVQAFRTDSRDHEVCRAWLEATVDNGARYGVSPQVLAGVVRVTTHTRVFAEPSPLTEAIAFCEALLARPQCVVVQPGPNHWGLFARLCVDADARGNLAPDAWYAALANEWGCEWITLDRDFARFGGLSWRTPG